MNKQTERTDMLEDCPFCGGEAEQQSQIFMGGPKYYPLAKCSVYRCCAGKIWHDMEQWNTRTSKTEWQDISSAPRDEMFIYALPNKERGGFKIGLAYNNVSGGKSCAYGSDISGATHWLPLPTPPQED